MGDLKEVTQDSETNHGKSTDELVLTQGARMKGTKRAKEGHRMDCWKEVSCSMTLELHTESRAHMKGDRFV